MSLSLRDQLLQAGIVSQKQAKEAARQQQQQQQGRQHLPKAKRTAPSLPQLAAQQAQLAKVARDQELNRRHQQQVDQRAHQAQIKQLIEQNCLPTPLTEESYYFADGSKIRRIPADTSIRQRLSNGAIVIVRCEGQYRLVTPAIAARIRERDESAVIASGGARSEPSSDDGYQDFAVPDDLIW